MAPVAVAAENRSTFVAARGHMIPSARQINPYRSCHADVWMPNHYHLLVETPEANLSLAMQWLNLSYSSWFNRRHDRSGHLFQGRFKAIVVNIEQWGLALSRYIHLNPVLVKRYGV